MDERAQEISNQVTFLTDNFGFSVSVKRVVITATTKKNVFGTPLDATPETFQTKVIVESEKMDLIPSLAGGKPKEVLKLIAIPNVFKQGDEIQYGSHTYKVEYMQPVPFAGSDVVDQVHAFREVD